MRERLYRKWENASIAKKQKNVHRYLSAASAGLIIIARGSVKLHIGLVMRSAVIYVSVFTNSRQNESNGAGVLRYSVDV